MYATCLFCNAALGANEAIEHFPVGRRLAYDEATGRLWVVCKTCSRWNLSPLETRWEAIEEAERLFRGTKLRASSDNIGLTRLKEGTELVRIGKPHAAEFATWRYGDQFGERHRKTWRTVGGSLALSAGSLALIGSYYLGYNLSVFGASTLGLGMGLNVYGSVRSGFEGWKKMRRVAATVRDEQGTLIRLTEPNAREVTLLALGGMSDWKLKVPRTRVNAVGPTARLLRQKESISWANDRAYLTGDVALRALATILPHVNSAGASKRGVKDAIAVIEETPNIQMLLRQASKSRPGYQQENYMDNGESALGNLPPSLRLALEMALHGDDERRAMKGELQELEQRWRDADAIAKIADGLLVPPIVDGQLQSMQRSRDKQ